MKREIKFRAWDNYSDSMYYQDGDEQYCTFAIDKNGVCCWILPGPPGYGQDPADLEATPCHEVMQYLGFKDKNGKEIYDSDILRIQYFKIIGGENLGVSEVDAELVGVVEITPLALVLKNIIGEKWCEYTGYEQGEGECKVFHLHDVYEGSSDAEYQIEVIGNIYENPELIK